MASEPKLGFTLGKISDVFTTHTSKPELFLGVQEPCAKRLKSCIKDLYDTTKSEVENLSADDERAGEALPELITENFDDEQIWQEIELQNDFTIQRLLGQVARIVAGQTVSFQSSSAGTHLRELPQEDEEDEEEEEEEEDEAESSDLPMEDEVHTGGDADAESESDDDNMLRLGGEGESDDLSEEEKELERALDRITTQDTRENPDDTSESDDNSDENSGLDSEMDSGASEEEEKASHKDTKQIRTKKETGGVKKRKTVVDDKFFKMDDMEKFLEREDLKEERKHSGGRKAREAEEEDEDDDDDEEDEARQEEDIDVFAELPSDDEEGVSGRHMTYADFFDPPDDEDYDDKSNKQSKKKKVKFDTKTETSDEKDTDAVKKKKLSSKNAEEESEEEEESDDDEEDEEDEEETEANKETKSSFEKRQEKLKKKITELEATALEKKPWQMMGEVTATARPENSLLQEDLDFEFATKLPQVVTEETTASLESIIIQRIKDKAWDDVERKVKKTEEPFEYKKRIVLDQEKSKLGLSEIYEQEYLKQAQQEEEEKPDPDHASIQKMMTSLFVQLDALSNFHYTPKPAAPEIQIVSNLPSIAVEEVAPVTASGGATLLAPQEVKEKEKGELKGDTEKSKTDRQRERRNKKKNQRVRQKQKLKKQEMREKANPDLANKTTKAKALRDLEKKSKGNKSLTIVKDTEAKKPKLTSSTKFFSQLQDEVTTHIESRKAEKRKKLKNKTKSAAAFKL